MKYLVLFTVVAALFVTGESLQCYECNKDKCDKASLKTPVNCTGTDNFCFKQIVTLTDKTTVTQRACYSPAKVAEGIANLTNTVSTEVHFCNKDSCNSVGTFTASLSIVFVTSIALMFASDRW
ncbi:uncharacterized protein LOC103568645 [Microplitis demolitor]|uniref:uncharacterized protein LOC103568645 n=1 Tax=Microplitis demolitor TaxID=69319 RepID=UPI0004CD6350|nr:uncharacterized protein LOC103568645 [Microplitis demolitor]